MAGTGDDDELARCKRALGETLLRAHLCGLVSPDPGRRRKAAGGLGALGPAVASAAAAALERALDDDDGRVRQAAAAALARIRPAGDARPSRAGSDQKQFLPCRGHRLRRR